MTPRSTLSLVPLLAVLVVAACATDTAVAPTIEMDRIYIWPDAKPMESFRERLGRIREEITESVRTGNPLPDDVLARWEKMEEQEAYLKRMEKLGFREKIVGPGASIMTFPDSGLSTETAGALGRFTPKSTPVLTNPCAGVRGSFSRDD